MKCVHPFGTDRHKRQADITLLFQYIYQFTHCFTLQTRDYAAIFDFCVDSVSLATSFKKYNVIMIKAHAVR